MVEQQRGRGHPVLLGAGHGAGAVLQRPPAPVAGVGVGTRGGGRCLGQDGRQIGVPRQHRGGVRIRLPRCVLQQQRQELGAAERRHRHGAVQVPGSAQHRVGAVLQQQAHGGGVVRRLGHGLLVLHGAMQRAVAMRVGRLHVDVGARGDQERGDLGPPSEAGVHQQRPVARHGAILRHRGAHRVEIAGLRRRRGALCQFPVHINLQQFAKPSAPTGVVASYPSPSSDRHAVRRSFSIASSFTSTDSGNSTTAKRAL